MFFFLWVGGPQGHKLRQFVALTQDVVVRHFAALTQDIVCPRSTKTQDGSRRAARRAGRALNYFFCLLKYFLSIASH